MASLNKLAIRGIRSFDDKHVQVIEFYSPLTVIVGHNGSGKTTIIECLKYATTGDMPPNTRSGAFVHDPKMAGEKEVKAQVRLRFWNAKRERMTATRNLQVTTKKTGGLTMKTLEGILAKTDADGGDGKRNTISTKCSEMDEELPYLLGVSKAILENVIFCHQEEANWPLSEPAALKKKFDDIFEATKYTKALDNIKLLRKERAQELKVDKERLKFLKADKDKAERMRKELQDSINLENRKETEFETLKRRYEDMRIRNAEFYENATKFRQLYEQSNALKDKIKMYEGNQKHARENMQLMDDSTEQLLHMLGNFDSHLRDVSTRRSAKVASKENEEVTLEDLRAKERSLASKQGGLFANRHMYERNLKERESVIRKIAEDHDITGYGESPLTDSNVEDFMDKMHELVKKAANNLRKLQTENGNKERELQETLDRLSTKKATAQATKRSKVDQIEKTSTRITIAEDKLYAYQDVSHDLEPAQKRLKMLTEENAQLQAEYDDAKYSEQIREKGVVIRQKEVERDGFSGELALLNRKADSRAKLDLQRKELSGKEAQVETLLSTHDEKFKELVGENIKEVDDIEGKITTAITRKDRELLKEENISLTLNKDYSQLQASVNHASEDLKTKEREIQILQDEIGKMIQKSKTEATTLAEAIELVKEELQVVQREIVVEERAKEFWNTLKGQLEANKRCEACNRKVQPGDEEVAVKIHLQKKIDRSMVTDPAYIQELNRDELWWAKNLARLQEVVPNQKKIDDLDHQVIPALKAKIEDNQKSMTGLIGQVEESKNKIQKIKNAIRDLQNLKSASGFISRLTTEARDLTADVSRLKSELESSGSSKTVEEVQKEIDRVNQEIKNLTRDQQKISGEKEVKITNLRSGADEVSRKSAQIAKWKNEQEKRAMEEEALNDMIDTKAVLETELERLDQELQEAEVPWRETTEALHEFKNERLNREGQAGEEVSRYQNSLGTIEGKHRACQAYLAEGHDRKIKENDTAITDLKRQISASNDARSTLEAEIIELATELTKSESLKSQINSNLKYREDELTIEKVKEEYEKIDLPKARASREKFNTEYGPMMDEETSTQGQMSLAQGQLLEMIENRKKLEKTLKMDYKNIDKEYKDQMIKTSIGEVANNDLEKYGKALDNAILKYHSIKMNQINDTIGHLWNKTYQGTDIDGIRIVSDHDEASTSTRKSYNYRVVMVKNEVELDMRGRCSAGQKVLASIIIRLALAESFGQGCGVLALDEPTTNLDQENINALAESLAEIIRERRQQTNFQLIVITHDEGFLERLAEQDVLEYYWRVSRDASQKSVLERQRVP